jgi:hypothetical protein
MFGNNNKDSIEVEILPDGTIKMITDPISPANHRSAEALVDLIKTLTGGPSSATKRPDAKKHHHHGHGHSHTH